MAYKDLIQPMGPFNTDFSREDYNELLRQGFSEEEIVNMSSEDMNHWLNFEGNGFTLINARERNRQHPDTFLIPSRGEIAVLKPGDNVKLIFDFGNGAERMWVKIDKVEQKGGKLYFEGKLDDMPADEDVAVKLGDNVAFSQDHIIDIITAKGG